MWYVIEVKDSMLVPKEIKISPTVSLGIGDSLNTVKLTCKMAMWGAIFVQQLKCCSGHHSQCSYSGLLLHGVSLRKPENRLTITKLRNKTQKNA